MIPLTVVAQTHLPAAKPVEAATGLRGSWAGQDYYDWERSRAESGQPGVADLAAQACRQLLLGANKPDDIGAIVCCGYYSDRDVSIVLPNGARKGLLM